MEVNVKGIMEERKTEQAESIIHPDRGADIKSAFDRLNALRRTLDIIQLEVNKTNLENTPDALRMAYVGMKKAFKDAMDEEKKIISNC